MGAEKINSNQISAESLQNLVNYLPQYMQAAAGQVLPTGQAQLEASKVLAPQQSQLEYDIYSRFAPMFSQVGTQIAGQQQLGQAANDLAVIRGAGGDLAKELTAAQRLADPEFYKMRELMLGGAEKLYGSLSDPSGELSGSERAEIDRTLARQNLARGTEAPTATSTVSDAMKFGAAGEARKNQRQDQIAKALGVSASAAPAMKSGVDVGAATLGRPIINSGESRLGAPARAGGEAFDAAGGMFNSFQNVGLQSAMSNQNRKTALDRANETMSAIGSLGSFFSI
jgi:hypothetical protein